MRADEGSGFPRRELQQQESARRCTHSKSYKDHDVVNENTVDTNTGASSWDTAMRHMLTNRDGVSHIFVNCMSPGHDRARRICNVASFALQIGGIKHHT